MDQLLFATYSPRDIIRYRSQAEQWQCGLELHTFIDPVILSNDLAQAIDHHRQLLDGFTGPLGFHGAFYDLISGSPDPDVSDLARRRYRQNLEVCIALKGEYVVFHANYMGTFKLANYRQGWHRRQVKFWRSLVREAADHGVCLLLENMWADDPEVIADILGEVDHPNLRSCFDVAHAALFSPQTLLTWIDVLQPTLFCCHLNNTDGKTDLHWPLGQGIINYVPILDRLRSLPQPPWLTLEMRDWETISKSLNFFDLPSRSCS